MTVQIGEVGAVILVIGCLVGYFVFKHSKNTPGPASRSDVVGAIGSAVAVITALVILFGGGSEHREAPAPVPPQTVTVPTTGQR
ncbi:hypothetical protein GCM10010353_71450 [Streptomyces chryseus]|uniref:hypothetical protein n=1 Tax=Streptomyces chryseus TaxID=68186 RepID=UPI00110F91DF|nr:hypothetical protein [Streptomyces chryseus]GGX46602.1 hypothetical protein GCM10010353_71450 [Streptomyces chryseus]